MSTLTHLTVGDIAPDFTAKDQNDKTVTLSAFKGKKKVILYFYPKDDTPGCTKEACNFRDNYAALKKKGYEVLGVSVDSVKKHKKFEEKYELPFTLVSDEDKQIVESYGVWGKKKFMGREYMGTNRVTFVIDKQGLIEKVIDKVEVDDATAQVLE